MAHLLIPLDGVPIVPSQPAPDFIAADGYVVFALADRRFYAYNQSTGLWVQAGGGIIVADTDSIDLTDTSGTLTADVRISTDAAPAGSVKATLTVQSGASPGLLAVVSESDIKALFSVTDSDSVDLTYTSGDVTADVRLSTNAADAGYQLVDLNIESLVSQGLRAQISNTAIQAALSVTDSNSIDMTYSGGALTGDVLLSADPPDLNYQAVQLSIKTPLTSKGLHAQIADSSIRSAITVADTNSIDFGYGSGQISADLRISAAAADAGSTKVNLDIQGTPNVGLRAQVTNSDIQGLFSATAPIQYSAGAFTFDTATTTLTAYLLKSGGTMTGAIVSAIPYSNTGVVTGSLQQAGWIDVDHLQSTVLTFDETKGESFKLSVSAAGHAGLELCAFYKHGLLTITTDQENKYQEADSGTGWYIHKGNNDNTITIKSRLGGTHKVLILVKEGVLTSATAWA